MSRHHDVAGRRTSSAEPVYEGPRWYRARIRLIGPLLGLVPMAALGLVSLASLAIGDGRSSGLLGLLCGVAAAPGLLVVGAPFADDTAYPLAVLASVPVWVILGAISAWRATRLPIATWHDYWREMLWMTVGVILGSIVALVAASAILGESLVI